MCATYKLTLNKSQIGLLPLVMPEVCRCRVCSRTSGLQHNTNPVMPSPCTAPLLQFLGPGELAPGMAAAEFAARRDNLAKLLPPGCIAVLPSAPIQYVTGVIPYPYRQDADFYYLTGLTQPSVAVIESTASSSGLSPPHYFHLMKLGTLDSWYILLRAGMMAMSWY